MRTSLLVTVLPLVSAIPQGAPGKRDTATVESKRNWPGYDVKWNGPSYNKKWDGPSYNKKWNGPSYNKEWDGPKYDPKWDGPNCDPRWGWLCYPEDDGHPGHEQPGGEQPGSEQPGNEQPGGEQPDDSCEPDDDTPPPQKPTSTSQPIPTPDVTSVPPPTPPTPTATQAPSPPEGPAYMEIVQKWLNDCKLRSLKHDPLLEGNALKASQASGGQLVHKMFQGTMAQVMAQGDLNSFESAFVGGWLCEIPSLLSDEKICKGPLGQGWSLGGQTGHAKILSDSQYTKIGCQADQRVLACDFA